MILTPFSQTHSLYANTSGPQHQCRYTHTHKHKSEVKIMIERKETPVLVGTPSPRVVGVSGGSHAYLGALFITGHTIGSFAFCSQREKHRAIIPATQTISRLRQCLRKCISTSQKINE